MVALLLLCLVGITLAQVPVPCTTPPQWEASLFDSNEERQFGLEGRLSYDSTYHRERIIDEVDEATEEDFYDNIALFDLKIEYIYNFKARNCTRRPLTRAWRDFGVRGNDTSYGEAYVGSSAVSGAGMLITIWGGNFTTPDNDTIGYISSWSYIGCVPIARTSFSPRFGISNLNFYDVTVGIRDPNVFIPRRECLSAEEWENRYTLFGTPGQKKM